MFVDTPPLFFEGGMWFKVPSDFSVYPSAKPLPSALKNLFFHFKSSKTKGPGSSDLSCHIPE